MARRISDGQIPGLIKMWLDAPVEEMDERRRKRRMTRNRDDGRGCLQYFIYWTPRLATWDFHDAPVRLDGTCSPTWDLLKAFNREVQACADILLNSRVVRVYHTEPVPEGTRGLDVSSPFSRIDGGEAVVGLHQLPGGRRYALIVNRSFNKAVTLRLTLQDWVRDVGWTQRAGGVEFLGVADRQATLRFEPGAAGFLQLNVSLGTPR